MLPVFVVSESDQRMQHIGKSVPMAQCVPLRSIKMNTDIMHRPIPALVMPSIIMLDMEGTATDDVAYYIKRLKIAYSSSAIVVLLPFGDNYGEQMALDAGADDILMRPVSMNRLSLTLRNLSELVHRRQFTEESSEVRHAALPHQLTILNEQGGLKRLHHLEQEIIQFAVKHCQGHISQAARALGIGRSTLYRKIDAMETRMRFEERVHGRKVFSHEITSVA